MIKRNYSMFIKDMLDAMNKIDLVIQNISYQDLLEDDKTSSAVIRKLEIIGEASKNIPANVRRKYSGIDWEGMAGMRDKLIHFYFGVDYEILWKVIKEDLPAVRPQVERMLRDMA